MWKTVCVNITYPSADCRKTWPKISITSMRKFADFTFHILKCREGPSFIYLVMSAMFMWTYSYVSFSSNSFFFFAWSACVTLWSVDILSCQFQSSLRTSKKIGHVLKPETTKRNRRNETTATTGTTGTTETKPPKPPEQPKRNHRNRRNNRNGTTETTGTTEPKRNHRNNQTTNKKTTRTTESTERDKTDCFDYWNICLVYK